LNGDPQREPIDRDLPLPQTRGGWSGGGWRYWGWRYWGWKYWGWKYWGWTGGAFFPAFDTGRPIRRLYSKGSKWEDFGMGFGGDQQAWCSVWKCVALT
jgi:hypothetical protein